LYSISKILHLPSSKTHLMKKIFYAILFLIALYFVLAFFGPRRVHAERSVSINAPASLLRQRLSDFHYFHNNWSPWTEKDPNMKTTFTGHAGQPGHQYAWSGNKEVGEGSMELQGYSGDSIIEKLTFVDQGDAKSYFIIKDKGQSTDVSWGLQFDVGFMWRTPMLFFDMGSMIGEDYEKGLKRLKQSIESEKQGTHVP
jgi:hypothetical protein